ncbi:hypothetical protein, partial [Gluconobacter albidus]|uniref:hypothetical protein n=1 Tax=Gluconobacter albidus TaxID=318683 RepID=UPI00222E693A
MAAHFPNRLSHLPSRFIDFRAQTRRNTRPSRFDIVSILINVAGIRLAIAYLNGVQADILTCPPFCIHSKGEFPFFMAW